MPINAVDLRVRCVHEGLGELEKNSIQVDHEAVRGNGVRVDLKDSYDRVRNQTQR